MMNDVFASMLSGYDLSTDRLRRNAVLEADQQVIVAGLYIGGFFDVAAFHGGTCLRIFHGLQRFSEDLDFSLLAPDDRFDFTRYFQPIVDAFALVGRNVEIRRKSKRNSGRVESAFLKDDTDVYEVTFQTEKSIRIKIEVDTCPPLHFRTEQRLLLRLFSLMVRCHVLPDLFAGKMHALAYRNRRNRAKGRDWYDFEWYVRHDVPLGFPHLAERVRQFEGQAIGREAFLARLKERLASANMGQVKGDVVPFVRNPGELDIWSNAYFGQLADRIRFED